jgi:acetolactate synthase-1/2/3 large subunit
MADHTGGDGVVDALEQAGVEVVFGIPSVHNLPVYDAIRRRGQIRAITVRHEQAAAGAADAYSRVTGRLGVFISSTGPGAANSMGGLLEAFVSGSPVLHLTGQIETRYLDAGRGFIHEVPDQPSMLKSLSKAVLRPGAADDIAQTVATAIGRALSAPAGPVSVELPIDLQYAPAAPAQRLESALAPESRQPASEDELRTAAELLSRARRPLVWAGGGAVASGAEAEVAALVRRLGAGLITSPNGRGILAEDEAACVGNLPWEPAVRELCLRADLLVGIGTRYQGPNTENWKMQLPRTIVQIDVEPARPARSYPASATVTADARQAVAALLERLGTSGSRPAEPGWDEEVRRAGAAARARLRSTLGPQEGLLDELAPLLDADTVVVKDSTIPAYTWGNRLLPVRRTRTAIMPNGFAIGLGLAHAVGAAVGSGGRPVVLLVGDGGIMLTVAELATIAEERLPVVVALFNDGGYGILRNIQQRQFDGTVGVDLGRPDFVALASALGVAAAKATSPADFGKQMGAALAAGEPFLVEVDLDAVGPMSRPYTGTSRPPETAVG